MNPNDLSARICRSPDDGAGGAAAPAAPTAPAAPAAAAVQPAGSGHIPAVGQVAQPAPDPYAITAGVKPGGLDDKFWDPQAKAIRLPELMKSYGEIQTLVTRRASEMSDPDFQRLVETRVGTMTKELEAKALQNIRGAAPGKPEDYNITLTNDDLASLPEHLRDTSSLQDDGLVNWFRGFAHDIGLGQEQFNKAIVSYLGTVNEMTQAQVSAEQSRLGPQAEQRLAAVKTFLETQAGLDKRQALALQNSLSNADAFAAVETMMARLADPSMIRGFGGMGDMGSAGPALATDEQIRQAQKDPRYWDPARRDPAYVRSIEAAWQRLYARQN